MNPELEAFEAARSNRALRTDHPDHETGYATRTRHEGTAADLARAYVDSHRTELEAKYAAFGIPRLVQLVDAARDRGDLETVAEIDAWLMAVHPPQNIGISVQPGGPA